MKTRQPPAALPILLLALATALLGPAPAQVTVPINVTILNAPTEILSSNIPIEASPQTTYTITLRVRDNNTLADVSIAEGITTIGLLQNASLTIENISPQYHIADYVFVFQTGLSTKMIGYIRIGDEELVHTIPFNIDIAEKRNITLITTQIDTEIRPGSSAIKRLQYRIETNTNATLYARIEGNNGIQIKIGDTPIQGTNTKIKDYPPGTHDEDQPILITITGPYPDKTKTINLILSLEEQEATAQVQVTPFPWRAIAATAIFIAALAITLVIAGNKRGV